MVVVLAINFLTRDLLAVCKYYSTLTRNSLALSVLGSVALMLFAIVICINIVLFHPHCLYLMTIIFPRPQRWWGGNGTKFLPNTPRQGMDGLGFLAPTPTLWWSKVKIIFEELRKKKKYIYIYIYIYIAMY